MIKRILVALDPDSDTPVAIRYAADIARHTDAEVNGLAVVDLENIEAEARGGGIGSMYFADKLRAKLTEETRAQARQLIEAFERALDGSGIQHSNLVEEGVPFRRILEDLKYYDLLVIGREPHFFYGNPAQETEVLANIIHDGVAPVFVVGTEHRPARRVLVAYDGSPAAARAMQYVVRHKPFGPEASFEVVHVYDGEEKESELMLRLVRDYFAAHGIEAKTANMGGGGHVADQIIAHAEQSGADVVVAGSHVVSKVRRLAFGSTTADLLQRCTLPLFLHH